MQVAPLHLGAAAPAPRPRPHPKTAATQPDGAGTDNVNVNNADLMSVADTYSEFFADHGYGVAGEGEAADPDHLAAAADNGSRVAALRLSKELLRQLRVETEVRTMKRCLFSILATTSSAVF